MNKYHVGQEFIVRVEEVMHGRNGHGEFSDYLLNPVTPDGRVETWPIDGCVVTEKFLDQCMPRKNADAKDWIPEPKAMRCPFCGEKDIRRVQLWFADSTLETMRHEDGTLKWTYLQCSRCNISTNAYCYEHQALKQWNRRVEPCEPCHPTQSECGACEFAGEGDAQDD